MKKKKILKNIPLKLLLALPKFVAILDFIDEESSLPKLLFRTS
jgi:hypothetical protein